MTQRTEPLSPHSVVVARTIVDLRAAVADARHSGKTVGLVPTMGALHFGHRALVEAARRETGFVVVSLFVNPTQFGPGEDLSRYPRTFDLDLELCAQGGADVVFAPEVFEVYPSGGIGTFVEVPSDIGQVLEGASRPGHFRGVATVVLKLFHMVQPDVAWFGAKDYQQQLILRRMVRDLDVPVRIETVATVREADGLAMSSRNRYLNEAHRQAANVLHRALEAGRTAVDGGERDVNRIRQIIRQTIESEPLAAIESVDLVDADTLIASSRLEPGQRVVALLAVRVGPARLIDNAFLSE